MQSILKNNKRVPQGVK